MTGYKTVIVNALIGVLALVEANIAPLGLEAETLAWITFGTTVANFALRAVTKTPIFQGE